MSTALIVGDVNRPKGFHEKPVLYSTVVEPHYTSITHNAGNNFSGIQLSQYQNRVLNNFPSGRAPDTEMQTLAKGQYSVPVNVTNKRLERDPTQTDYDSPMFIQKSQNKKQIAGLPLNSAQMNL